MLRLFVGLAIPEAVRARIAGIMGGLPGARWVAGDDLHLTLRFIGEVDEGRAADIDANLSRVRFEPFPLILRDVGIFGTGRIARTLWCGVETTPALSVLHGRVEAAVTRAGEPREARAFAPHVTLARLDRPDRGRLAEFLAGNALFRAEPFTVDRFHLYRSHLGHGRGGGGPRYEVVGDYGTEGAPGGEWSDDWAEAESS